jgi:hypothetical protein
MRMTNSAVITSLGLAILSVMGWRGTDISGSVVALCTAYVASRAGLKGTGMIAASRDPTADTNESIRILKD